MKNQLRENMRRFGTKNLQEVEYTIKDKDKTKLEFSKVKVRGQGNLLGVKNITTGDIHVYAIYFLKGIFGKDAMNFESIESVGDGIRINRWVDDGETEAHDIPQNKLQTIDSSLAQGKTVTYKGLVKFEHVHTRKRV